MHSNIIKKIVIFVFVFSFLTSFIQYSYSFNSPISYDATPTTINEKKSFNSLSAAPSSVLGVATAPHSFLHSDHIKTGEMEQYDSFNIPQDFTAYGSAYQNGNASYTEHVANGSYAGDIYGVANNISPSMAYLANYPTYSANVYLSQNIYLFFYYYIAQTPNLSKGSTIYVRVSFSSGKSIYYYLSYLNLPTNTSNYVYYGHNTSNAQSWYKFEKRNITADYESGFGSCSSSTFLNGIYFRINAAQHDTDPVEFVIDTVELTNSTDYDFLESYNGDFERGNGQYWSTNNVNSAYVSPTYFHVNGDKALNITTASDRANSQSSVTMYYYLQTPLCLSPDADNSIMLDFYWYYRATEQTENNAYSYITLFFLNDTTYVYMDFLLGSARGYTDLSNYTSSNRVYKRYALEEMDTQNQWIRSRINISDIYYKENFHNLSISYFSIYSFVYGEDNRIMLLVDDLHLFSYTLGDPGFEETWSNTLVINSWTTSTNNRNYLNISTDSKAGKNSLNLTTYNNFHEVTVRRDFYLAVKDPVLFQFWHKISKLEGSSAYYYLKFDVENDTDSVDLVYLFGNTTAFFYDNDSTSVLYIQNQPVNSKWSLFKRNITNDVISYFSNSNWTLTNIHFIINSGSVDSTTSVLLDEVQFVDISLPIIYAVNLQNTPKYYDKAHIIVKCNDSLSEIDSVKVYYTDNTSTWSSMEGNYSGFDLYTFNLPLFYFGAVVRYYINASDATGNYQLYGDPTNSFEYTVIDDVLPSISLLSPYNNSIISGDVQVKIDASDAGSNIKQVTLYANDTPIASGNGTTPYTLIWHTREYENAVYNIKAKATDYAGNEKNTTEVIYVTLQNDLSPPLLSNLQTNPAEPEYNQSVKVIVGVYDQSEVKNITLFYKIGDREWQNVPMIGSALVYEATIPGAPWNTQVLYYVIAYDIHDQVAALGSYSSPYSYTTVDKTEPQLLVDGPPTSVVLSGDNIQFMVNGTDEGSGIAKLIVTIENDTIEITNVPYTYFLNSTNYKNGYHTLKFELFDNANNSIVMELTYKFQNGFIPSINSVLNSYYGIAIGAGGVIIIIGLIAILPKIIGKKPPK